MPDVGYTSPSGDDADHLMVMRSSLITMPEAGAAGVTMTWRLFDDANLPGDSVKAGIFSADGSTLLAESAVRTDISTQGEYTFSGGGFATFAPVNGASYQIAVIANDVSVNVVYDNVVSPAGTWRQDNDLSTFGPPMAFAALPLTTNDTRTAIGYMTYTSAAAGATLSGATPSGTLGTQTTATIGATTDQTTGNFYAVVDVAANMAGITATQIKAGQHAGGTAAIASEDAAVSTTTPSVGITGLTAGTLYSYAVVQNNANGDSNVLTGTFTTAAASPSSRPPPTRGPRMAVLLMT
jgi:hypothetical protein